LFASGLQENRVAEFSINIDSNIDQVLRFIAAEPQVIKKAVARTLNRLATQARTQFVREIRGVYNVRAADVRKAIGIKQRATSAEPTSVLEASGRPVSLAHFGARQTRTGVSFKVLKRGARKRMRSAFILQRGGGPVVFARGRYSGGRLVYAAKAPRLPIQKLFGPAIPSMFSNREVNRVMTRFVANNFGPRFTHELLFARGQAGTTQ